jgi:hypothetical protein
MPFVEDRGPPQKAAMFLKCAQAEERLRVRGPGYACCLSTQFPVSRAPAHGPPCRAGLYGAS